MISIEKKMQKLDFPKVTDIDIVFGGYPQSWFNKTLELPEDKKYSSIASSLFFKSGTIPTNKSLPEDYTSRSIRLFKTIIGFWKPKHEHKIHICGLILKSLCEP